jgi:hypothetical protein
VSSIYRPHNFEPITVNRTLRRGRTMTFESGPAANHHVLTEQYIFNSRVAPGRIQVRRRLWIASWIDAIRQTRAEPVFGTSSKPTIARPARWLLRHAATSQGADTGAGVAGVRIPVCYQRPGLPGLDARRSRFEGLGHLDGLKVPEPLFCGNEGV